MVRHIRWERFFHPDLRKPIKGEEVSRPDVNLLPRWVHGSPKSGDFTKCTICGNIRERCLFSSLVMQLIRDCMDRNLQKRRDIREKAWQNDGWAETVSKARFPMTFIRMTWLSLRSPDGATGTDNGCFYFDAAVIQSSEIRFISCVYSTVIPTKLYDVACLFWSVRVIKRIGGNITRPIWYQLQVC